MKAKGKIILKKSEGLPGRCLRIGGTLMTLNCGLAYAGNSLMKGDASGISIGLTTVRETIPEAETLIPEGKKGFQSFKNGVLGLIKELKPGKHISKKAAGEMLARIRGLSGQVNKIHSEASKSCV